MVLALCCTIIYSKEYFLNRLRVSEQKYLEGKTCKKCGSNQRYVSTGNCVDCARRINKARMRENPQKNRERAKLWAQKHPERSGNRKYSREYHQLHCARRKARQYAALGSFSLDEWITLKKQGCVRCGEMEDLICKYIISPSRGGSGDISNIQAMCKKCMHPKIIGKRRRTHMDRLRVHGISDHIYEAMIDNQNNQCDICKGPFDETRLTNIDHDHSNGKVRGILCRSCNWLLGNAGDNIHTLENAITYLKKHQEKLVSAQRVEL